MILKRLTLEDFGVYAGKQVVELAPPSPDSPVVILGGQNGEGKTTLLEAILHVLYGPHAGSIIGRGGRYEQYLKSSINHSASPGRGAAVQLELTTVRDGQEVELRVRRSWQAGEGPVREQLTVEVNGTFDKALTDGWGDFVETLVPRGVAPLFFFDGEQIESLANLEGASATIRAAVGSLLGLDLVEQLRADLLALQRRHAPKVVSGDAKDELDRAEELAVESDERIGTLKNEIATTRSALDQAENALRRTVEDFKKQGGELFEAREVVEAEVAASKTVVMGLQDELRELAEGFAPLLLVRELLSGLVERARLEDGAALAGELSSLLEARDLELLEWFGSESGAQEKLVSKVEEWLASSREHLPSSNAVERVVALDSINLRRLEHLDDHELDQIQQRISDEVESLSAARAEAEQGERRLAQIPSTDAISELIEARDAALSSRDETAASLRALEADLEVAARERERRYDDRDRVLRKVAELGLAEGDSKRILEHADKARKTLVELQQQAVARHMARIEGMVMRALGDLLRKDSLIEEVKIDPSSFELQLFGRGGRKINASDLSAGERQLTALSLLWGLARASERPLPLVIDTPLGRLDSTHRQLLLERYLPKASHQVIVLSTDTEVDAEALSELGDAVGRTYRLVHSDEDQSTKVEEGYFFDSLEVAA